MSYFPQIQTQGFASSGAAKAGNPVEIGGVFNTTQPTVTTGQAVELQSTARGAVIVATGADVFAVTTTPPTNASTNVTQFGGTNISTGTGVGGAGIPRVTVSSDSFPATQPVSGTVTVTQATAANLNAQVQGAAAADTAQSGNPVLVAGVDNAGNVQELPVADTGTATPAQTLIIGGTDGTNALQLGFGSGGLGGVGLIQSNNEGDGIGNSQVGALGQKGSAAGAGLRAHPYVFNGSTWDRLRSAVGTLGIPAINTEGTKTTYKLAGFVTPAATPTDVINIQGSGTKTIRITRIAIHIEATAAGIVDVALIRRSTANSGGTSTSPTIGKMDTNNAAATAVVLVYTANPTTPGTTVANLGAGKSGFVTSGGLNPIIWDFTTRNGQGLVLRGTSDFLSVNGNGDTLLTGEVWAYDIEWTEE